tara:strand:+ start:62 stop:265 length:204 start_codon:yes stop_codon:yes gene_type:complete
MEDDLPQYAYVINGMNKEFDKIYNENLLLKKEIDILKLHMKEPIFDFNLLIEFTYRTLYECFNMIFK